MGQHFMKLVVSQIALDGASAGTIQFFVEAYPLLTRERGISCTAMAGAAYIARQHARRHLDWLVRSGCVKRVGYRAWKLSDKPLKDNELAMMSMVIVDGGASTMKRVG